MDKQPATICTYDSIIYCDIIVTGLKKKKKIPREINDILTAFNREIPTQRRQKSSFMYTSASLKWNKTPLFSIATLLRPRVTYVAN